MIAGAVNPDQRITIVITTRDEELHIGRCIESVRGLGRVVVVDSESRDATQEIAEGSGAEVVEHAWEGYAAQKNWALSRIAANSEWALFMDADEFLTDHLRSEIRTAIENSSAAGFYVARENVVLGRRLKHAWWYPDYQMRLFRPERARFEDRLVHEHVLVDGPTAHLDEPLIHENLKGVGAWMERHISYAALEASEMRRALGRNGNDGVQPKFLGSRLERRRAIKTRIWYRLPFRPAIRFLWLYIVKRGFLDGRAGRAYCELVAAYEALIDANLLELELREDVEAGQR
jgi:glycosyltransferase involved in cell wall biosynthesis